MLQTSTKLVSHLRPILLLVAFGGFLALPGTASAECKGSNHSSCKAQSSCSWVDGYTRKDGAKVKSFCRNKPGQKKSLKSSSSSKLKAKSKAKASSSSVKKSAAGKSSSVKKSRKKTVSQSKSSAKKTSKKIPIKKKVRISSSKK